jgi:hypothetical protein
MEINKLEAQDMQNFYKLEIWDDVGNLQLRNNKGTTNYNFMIVTTTSTWETLSMCLLSQTPRTSVSGDWHLCILSTLLYEHFNTNVYILSVIQNNNFFSSWVSLMQTVSKMMWYRSRKYSILHLGASRFLLCEMICFIQTSIE